MLVLNSKCLYLTGAKQKNPNWKLASINANVIPKGEIFL
jgi:hypothetical protein